MNAHATLFTPATPACYTDLSLRLLDAEDRCAALEALIAAAPRSVIINALQLADTSNALHCGRDTAAAWRWLESIRREVQP